jgi:hypothetical protein
LKSEDGKLLAATILEEEDDNLLVYCKNKSAMGIFNKRKDEGYYSSLIGKYFIVGWTTGNTSWIRRIFSSLFIL